MPQSKSLLTKIDLRTAVPSGWQLEGLTDPKFDGVNYFRNPQGSMSKIQFRTNNTQFIQLEYQLYSPKENVTGIVKLDGKIIGKQVFPAGKFIDIQTVGAFVQEGNHQFLIEYQCQMQSCYSLINQYWTRVSMAPTKPRYAIESVGLNVQRWWLNAPNSPLTIQGTGPLSFDGINYIRKIQNKNVILNWNKAKGFNSSTYIYAQEPFKVTTSISGRVLSIQEGNRFKGVYLSISLIKYPNAHSLNFEVQCLKTGSINCASMYFTQVAVDTASVASPLQVIVVLIVTILFMFLFGRMLRLNYRSLVVRN